MYPLDLQYKQYTIASIKKNETEYELSICICFLPFSSIYSDAQKELYSYRIHFGIIRTNLVQSLQRLQDLSNLKLTLMYTISTHINYV